MRVPSSQIPTQKRSSSINISIYHTTPNMSNNDNESSGNDSA